MLKKAWIFDTTGDAYDAVQTHDEIKTGDTLLIPSEQIVGLAYTWPVAVTAQVGKLHTVASGPIAKLDAGIGDKTGKPVFTEEQVEFAQELARSFGWAVRQ